MAVATGAAFLGATLMGAMAYDLSNYPAPFVEDGMAAGAIVVGANAATTDVLGAIDIAASLQAGAVTETEISGSAGVTVEGGEDVEDIELNTVPVYGTFDDGDLEGFVDSDFDFDDTDYDYEDMLVIPNGAIVFNGSLFDQDFGSDIYGVIEDASAIQYKVQIDKDFDYALVGATDHDEDITFKFLGVTVEVTGFPSATSMTIEGSQEFYMEQGDTVTVDDHEVTLKKVGDDVTIVTVDGQSLTIAGGANEEFDQSGDFEVEVKSGSVFYIEGATDNSATLKLGTTLSKTVDDGDSAELFGEPTEEREADWVWNVEMNSSALAYSIIGLDLNIDRDQIGADEDTERNAMAVGDSIDFPSGYASIEFAALEVDDFAQLTILVDDRIDLESEDASDSTSDAWGFDFTTDTGDEDFIVAGVKTDEVWVTYNTSTSAKEIWYADGSDEVRTAENTFTMVLDTEVVTFTPLNVSTANASANVYVTAAFTATTSESITFGGVWGNSHFGVETDDESEDFGFESVTGTTDYDGGYVMMDYGAYFVNPANQFNSGDTFEITVPSEQQEVTVLIKSKGSTVSAGSEGGMSYSVNPIALGLGVLDTAATIGTKPMIVVGGPNANTAAAELMGNPTPEVIAETFQEGKGIIKYYDDKQAMLVAGWGAQDTQGAAYVLAKYDLYSTEFVGNELEIVVTDLENIEVNAIE